LTALLRRGIDSGLFTPSDPELSAQALWTAVFGLAARLVLEPGLPAARREALIERHIEILIRGLETR